MKTIAFFIIGLITTTIIAQDLNYSQKELTVSQYIDGTLLMPNNIEKPELVIIIAGSGPTDRNGNSSMTKNNSLRYLAEGLSNKGISTFRYDKRSVKMLKTRDASINNIEFDDFVEDAITVVQYFKRSNEFSKIHVAGHSQGSLLGMIAANNAADSFISLAGTGQPIDGVIVTQIAKQQPGLDKSAADAFAEIRENGSTKNYEPALASIFGPQVQPFMASWMKYDPATIIKSLDMPILIVNGTKDMQTSEAEAELLKASVPDASYAIIKNMNHLFKEIQGNDMENGKSYQNPNLPVMPELIETVVAFIKK